LNRLAQPEKKLIPVALPCTISLVNIYLPKGIRMEVPAHVLAGVLSIVDREGHYPDVASR